MPKTRVDPLSTISFSPTNLLAAVGVLNEQIAQMSRDLNAKATRRDLYVGLLRLEGYSEAQIAQANVEAHRPAPTTDIVHPPSENRFKKAKAETIADAVVMVLGDAAGHQLHAKQIRDNLVAGGWKFKAKGNTMATLISAMNRDSRIERDRSGPPNTWKLVSKVENEQLALAR